MTTVEVLEERINSISEKYNGILDRFCTTLIEHEKLDNIRMQNISDSLEKLTKSSQTCVDQVNSRLIATEKTMATLSGRLSATASIFALCGVPALAWCIAKLIGA